jgi:hypothetical protein
MKNKRVDLILLVYFLCKSFKMNMIKYIKSDQKGETNDRYNICI